jgi:hypothetical protein
MLHNQLLPLFRPGSRSVCGGEGQLVSECQLESPPAEGGVTSSSQTPPLVEEEASLINTYSTCLEENTNLGHGSRLDLKPIITVLARASSSLTDRPLFGGERVAIH